VCSYNQNTSPHSVKVKAGSRELELKAFEPRPHHSIRNTTYEPLTAHHARLWREFRITRVLLYPAGSFDIKWSVRPQSQSLQIARQPVLERSFIMSLIRQSLTSTLLQTAIRSRWQAPRPLMLRASNKATSLESRLMRTPQSDTAPTTPCDYPNFFFASKRVGTFIERRLTAYGYHVRREIAVRDTELRLYGSIVPTSVKAPVIAW